MKFYTVILLSVSLLTVSCSKLLTKKSTSSATGWEYNNPNNGGFQYNAHYSQSAGPGLVFVQGGTFFRGRADQDVIFDNNNVNRRVTFASFFMEETEVRNIDCGE